MPYSEKQRRWAYTAAGKKALGASASDFQHGPLEKRKGAAVGKKATPKGRPAAKHAVKKAPPRPSPLTQPMPQSALAGPPPPQLMAMLPRAGQQMGPRMPPGVPGAAGGRKKRR